MALAISCRLSAAVAREKSAHGESKTKAAEDGGRERTMPCCRSRRRAFAFRPATALWRVSGNTLPHRTLLRDAGGTWNRLDKCWEFTGEDPTAKLAAAIEAAPPPRPQQRRATEPPSRTITAIARGCATGC